MVGDLAALGSAACWAFGTILVKGPTSRLSALYINAFRNIFSATLVVVVATVTLQLPGIADIPVWDIAIMLGASVVVVVGDVGFVRAIALDDMSRVFPIASGLFVLASVGATALIEPESVTWRTPLGGLLVIGGVYLIAMARQPESDRQSSPNAAPRRRGLAFVLSVITALLWTLSLLGMNKAMESAAPLPAAALRIPFTTMLFMLMAAGRGDIRTSRLQRQDVKALVASGLLVGLSALLFTIAIKWSAAGNVAILSATSPLFVVPLAYFVLKERMTRGVLLGTGICMVGVWLTMW